MSSLCLSLCPPFAHPGTVLLLVLRRVGDANRSAMSLAMFVNRHEFKILKAVIRLILVPVVHMLEGCKRPSQGSLKQDAVLTAPAPLPIREGDADVDVASGRELAPSAQVRVGRVRVADDKPTLATMIDSRQLTTATATKQSGPVLSLVVPSLETRLQILACRTIRQRFAAATSTYRRRHMAAQVERRSVSPRLANRLAATTTTQGIHGALLSRNG